MWPKFHYMSYNWGKNLNQQTDPTGNRTWVHYIKRQCCYPLTTVVSLDKKVTLVFNNKNHYRPWKTTGKFGQKGPNILSQGTRGKWVANPLYQFKNRNVISFFTTKLNPIMPSPWFNGARTFFSINVWPFQSIITNNQLLSFLKILFLIYRHL